MSHNQQLYWPLMIFGVLFVTVERAAAERQDQRPNILFIFTDDQSHRTVRCYDESPQWVQTPNIDGLAREGVRFHHACAGPWCVPSRVSILTGRQLHGIHNYPATFPFWQEALRNSGYHTAMIGKWHQYYHPPNDGMGKFWDYAVMWKKMGPYYEQQKVCIDGGAPQDLEGYATDNYTRLAIDYIKRDHDRPWYLWLCYSAVHAPYLPAGRHLDRYHAEPVEIPTDIYPPRANKPAWVRDMEWYWKPGSGKYAGVPVRTYQEHGTNYDKLKGVHPDSLTEMVRLYNRAVLALDEGVGRIIEALKQTGQLNNTLIVFTSDNGYAFGQHGFEDKVAPYDACMRVPLIVRLPSRVAQGMVCEHPVGQLDLVATFFALAKTTPPFELHGHDLSPILQNPEADWAHPLLCEHFAQRFGDEATKGALTGDEYLHGVPWWLSLRQGRYKYIRYLLKDEIDELYDIESDPEELNNLAIDSKFHYVLVDYRQRLEKELRRTQASNIFVDNLPKPKSTDSP